MPGYDKDRFINLKEANELICGICHGIFIDPKVTPCCNQTYCGDCIVKWLTYNSSCPNDRIVLYVKNLFPAPTLVNNKLNQLLMKCEFSKNGCQENIILENIKLHTKICAYNLNTISIDNKDGACASSIQEDASHIVDSCCATLRFKIEGFSNMSETRISPPTIIRNIPFNILVTQRTYFSHKYLGFYLQCNGVSNSMTWPCNASAELKIISQKEGVDHYSKNFKRTFHMITSNKFGNSHFMGWNDILDPQKGYIKDDAIILEVVVTVDAPLGVS